MNRIAHRVLREPKCNHTAFRRAPVSAPPCRRNLTLMAESTMPLNFAGAAPNGCMTDFFGGGSWNRSKQRKRRRNTLSTTFPPVNLAADAPAVSQSFGPNRNSHRRGDEVHRDKGPGLIESIYEWCLVKELGLHALACVSQKLVVICLLLLNSGATRLRRASPSLVV